MRDETLPTGPWTFDEDVTDAFDDMLSRSIPDLDGMRLAVTRVGLRTAPRGSLVVDVGCSRGDALEPFADAGHPCLGLDVSAPMLDAARTRYADNPRVRIIEHDLRDGLPSEALEAGLVVSVLSLMFTPIEHRHRILHSIARTNAPLLLVEKVLGSDAWTDTLLVETYLDYKRTSGYTEEQIERKRLSLQGVLVPLTAKWNEDALARAGFRSVEPIWRCLNFAAWIAKP